MDKERVKEMPGSGKEGIRKQGKVRHSKKKKTGRRA